jgi:hypothetical protein
MTGGQKDSGGIYLLSKYRFTSQNLHYNVAFYRILVTSYSFSPCVDTVWKTKKQPAARLNKVEPTGISSQRI